MAAQSPSRSLEPAGLRLATLINIRWITITCQSAGITLVHFWLGFSLPVVECATTIAAAAALNIVLLLKFSPAQRLTDVQAIRQLSFDTVQLAILLYLTGGLGNPFSLLFLAPVTIAASALQLGSTVTLIVISLICISAIAVIHLPLPWSPLTRDHIDLPPLYILGVWIAFCFALSFLAHCSRRVTTEMQRIRETLLATEMALDREARLSTLDGLAAAAAHDLGTPLSTIAVVVGEMVREHGKDPAMAEDLAILSCEAARCRDLLKSLAGRIGEFAPERIRLSAMLDGIIAGYAERDVEIVTDYAAAPGDAEVYAPEPEFVQAAGVVHALHNVIDNAVDFAKSRVLVQARWDGAQVSVEIVDDGPGIAPDILDRLGNSPVTKRTGDGMNQNNGYGIGYFIAKTIVERSGGEVTITNCDPPASGTVVRLAWPLTALEAGQGKRHAQSYTNGG